MRAIISVVLIALLLATPVTQVLGQAHQQASIAPQPSAVNPPPIHSVAFLEPVSWESWVPTLESSRATDLRLAPGAVGRWDTTEPLSAPVAAGQSSGGTIALVVVVVVVIVLVVFAVAASKVDFGY